VQGLNELEYICWQGPRRAIDLAQPREGQPIVRTAAKVALGVLVALCVAALIAVAVYRDVPAEELEAAFAQPPSRFMMIDGVRIHYRDEGNGPTIVLLHANYSSLYMWEPWVERLRSRYRIIRLDLPAHGLTGPAPDNDYTLERMQSLFEGFIAAQRLERFVLAGTSIGGTIAMRYAADHPDRVAQLVLISPGSLEPRVRGRTTPVEIPAIVNVLAYITPRSFTRYMLSNDYGDPARLDEAIVTQWYTMWRREGNRLAMLELLRQYVSGGVEEKIRAVQAPVLLLWGEHNRRVPVALAYETRALLENAAEVRLEILPGVGHMLVQEAPQQSASIIEGYLAQKYPSTTTPFRISADVFP
jgi:pimeloyl-ACP methyl ester carboxylesterase